MIAFWHQYATQISLGLAAVLSAAGTTLPDLGTKDFIKVWAHDFFKLITISRSQSAK